MSLEEKAEELANAISESTEFEELREVEKELENDEEAQDIMQKFQSKQQQLQMLQQAGQEIDEDMKTELQSMRSEMQENEIISKLMDKQKGFNEIMEKVNNVLSTAIQGEESGCGSDHDHGCSGGCC
ncbi:MAG: YlbF family regulator [Bacillota bacterium]